MNKKGFTIISKASKGFTLIELMVAIAIVAVLATVAFTLFQGAQSQARDARRKGDIDSIATVLENNFDATLGTYKALTTGDFSAQLIPTDPLTNRNYTILSLVAGAWSAANTVSASTPAASASKYFLCAFLEKPTGNFTSNTNASASVASGGTYYCRYAQQQ